MFRRPSFTDEARASGHLGGFRCAQFTLQPRGISGTGRARAQEHSMRVWIGFQRDDTYLHEWTGEVAEESDMGKAIGNAIGNAITVYMKTSGKPIWGTTIMVDKA
jgi:hypothetical protein